MQTSTVPLKSKLSPSRETRVETFVSRDQAKNCKCLHERKLLFPKINMFTKKVVLQNGAPDSKSVMENAVGGGILL